MWALLRRRHSLYPDSSATMAPLGAIELPVHLWAQLASKYNTLSMSEALCVAATKYGTSQAPTWSK